MDGCGCGCSRRDSWLRSVCSRSRRLSSGRDLGGWGQLGLGAWALVRYWCLCLVLGGTWGASTTALCAGGNGATGRRRLALTKDFKLRRPFVSIG